MGKLKLNHNGFSAVEGILIFIVVAIIGFTGWFVWHSRQVTDKTLTSNPSGAAVTNNLKTTTTQSSTNKNVIKITALGVEVTVPDSIKDIVIGDPYAGYTSDGTKVTSVNLSTGAIDKAVPSCKEIGLGSLNKTPGTYPKSGVNFTDWHMQLGGFYLTHGVTEGPCYDEDSVSSTDQQLISDSEAVFEKTLSTVKEIQN